MALAQSGHVERLPSGSLRVSVYVGKDPLSGKQFFREPVKDERSAQIALGKLLKEADAGKRPEARVTVAQAIARYMEVTQLDLSTRRTYDGYICRTILPALGAMELRKIRGPLLDTFSARLRKCGDLRCDGRPFLEHSSFPPLEVTPGSQTAWQEVVRTIREAIQLGQLREGEQLPSAREMADRYGLRLATTRHALAMLDEQGLIEVHQGRPAVVRIGAAGGPGASAQRAPQRAVHDCVRLRCPAHVCRPMAPLP